MVTGPKIRNEDGAIFARIKTLFVSQRGSLIKKRASGRDQDVFWQLSKHPVNNLERSRTHTNHCLPGKQRLTAKINKIYMTYYVLQIKLSNNF